jgi:4-alpha-glucanotransferase
MEGKNRIASRETLAAILGLMGIDTSNRRSVREALRWERLRKWRTPVEPVTVIWDGKPRTLCLRFPSKALNAHSVLKLHYEDGASKTLRFSPDALHGETTIEGERYLTCQVQLPQIPFGYHQLEVQTANKVDRSLLISAPMASYSSGTEQQNWGLFVPLYALHSNQSWGAGNLSDWTTFTEWAHRLGANAVATLPLMAQFLGEPGFDPGPYAPATRLFWNEFYVDLHRATEFAHPPVQRLLRTAHFQKRLSGLRSNDFVQYRAGMVARRAVLEIMARAFFSRNGSRQLPFQSFLKRNPQVLDYAEFRATCDRTQKPWDAWDERLRQGELKLGDFETETKQYYMYCQWLADQQVRDFVQSCRAREVLFHLDLPVGVHPQGYDAWREQRLFAPGATVGAPPDLFFSEGQNWGFTPLQPQRLRQSHYAYVLNYLRFQMAHCQILRIDHIMGLHRLYWIPPGASPQQGVYVNYPAEEFYALLSLESHRHQLLIVGENLGTVPPQVNRAMARHRIRKTYVLQFAQSSDPRRAIQLPPPCSVATLNTHDTPAFAAHWRGDDIDERAAMGLIRKSEVQQEQRLRRRKNRALTAFLKRHGLLKKSMTNTGSVIEACLRWLAQSRAETVLINLEDLWQETRRQNTPGTAGPPNWRRKARFCLEQICQSPALRKTLLEINRLRRR